MIKSCITVLVKSFAHLNQIFFFVASLEERGKLWKWLTDYGGVLQLTNFLGIKAMDDIGVVMTPFGDVVTVSLVANSYVDKVAKGNDKK